MDVSGLSSLSSSLSIEASEPAWSHSEPATWPMACKKGYKDRTGCVMSTLQDLNRGCMNTHAKLHRSCDHLPRRAGLGPESKGPPSI